MVRLPGWLLMVAGAIVIGYTKLIESRREANLGFFFWAGVAFVVYGFAREVLARIARPKAQAQKAPPPVRRDVQQDHRHPAGHHFHGQSPHQTHQHTRPQQHPSHPHQPAHKACPRCHNANVGYARYCHACGQRF